MNGIFFIKKCVRSFIEVVIIVDYVSVYICICCGYTTLLHRGIWEGAIPFPGLFHFTLDKCLTSLSVKQGGIKYHF